MKNKLQQFIVKLLAATLAIIMAVPTNVFAMKQRKSNIYTAATSVMGIQEKDTSKEETENTDSSLIKSAVSTEETTDYIIEKSASLSKTTGQVDYKIVVKTKDPSKEFTENQTTTFAITENTDLKDLKVEKVQALDANSKETDLKYTVNTPKAFNNTDNLRTLGLTTTKPQYGMVYYLSAQLTEEALKNLEEKSPQLSLDFTIASPNQDIFQTRYSLETTKADTTEITIDNDGNLVNQTLDLVEKEDNLHLYKGEYKKEEKTLFQTTPAHLVWTDYINAKDDKEFTIDFNLDENQDTENSQIKIDYYEASDKGYVLNQSFSKAVDFANSLNLTIPQGYIAKVSLSTAIKENTNAKAYTFNGVKVANPSYKEETTEKTEEDQTSDDADPLPSDSSKNDEETKPSNDSIADESKQDFSQSPKSDTSAITLNKEAYLENLRNEDKLTQNLEKATNDIELALESYNKEETNWDEFKLAIQNISKEQNLDQAQAEETLQALLAGLNEDKYKVANIDTKEATSLVEESTVQSESTDATEKSVDELVKEKLNEEGITIEDFQNYMYELEAEYGLTNEDAARIYGNNAEAIQALVNKAQEEKTTGDVFASIDSLVNREFNLVTEMNVLAIPNWQIPAGWWFDINIGPYLKPDPKNPLKDLTDSNGNVVATPEYIQETNTIRYTFPKSVKLNKNLPIEQKLAFNTSNIPQDAQSIDINISVKPKNNTRQSMPTITVNTNETSPITTAFPGGKVPAQTTPTSDAMKRTYPYDVSYWTYQYWDGEKINWDIKINTSEVKLDYLNFNNLGLALYAPENQGLENYKVTIQDYKGSQFSDNPRGVTSNGKSTGSTQTGTLGQNGNMMSFNSQLKKSELPDQLYIHVEATPKANSPVYQMYDLGIRLTPDVNYISDILEDFKDDWAKLVAMAPWVIPYKNGEAAAEKFAKGFNVLDTRLPADAKAGWAYDNTFDGKSYNDKSRSVYGKYNDIDSSNDITWQVSDTLRLQDDERLLNSNSTLGNDIIGTSRLNDNQTNISGPQISVLEPNIDGSFAEILSADNLTADSLRESLRRKRPAGLLPGTIINYTYTSKSQVNTQASKIDINFNNRYDDGAGNYGGNQTASIVKEISSNNNNNINTPSQVVGPSGRGTNRTNDGNSYNAVYGLLDGIEGGIDDRKGYVKSQIISQNGQFVYCVNPRKHDPGDYYNKITLNRYDNVDASIIKESVNRSYSEFRTTLTAQQLEDALKKVFYFTENYDGFSSEADKYYTVLALVYRAIDGNIGKGYGDNIGYNYTNNLIVGSAEFAMHEDYGTMWMPNTLYGNIVLRKNPNDLGYRAQSAIKIDQIIKESKISQSEINQAVTLDLYRIGTNTDSKPDIMFQELIGARVRNPINFKKVDSITNKPVNGATFEITSTSNSFKQEFSPNESLDSVLYLDPGEYRLVEKVVPTGYEKLEDTTFNVKSIQTEKSYPSVYRNGNMASNPSSAGSIKSYDYLKGRGSKISSATGSNLVEVSSDGLLLTAKNEPTEEKPEEFGFKINKKLLAADGKYHNLPGIEFELKNKSSTETKKSKTDKNGIASFDNLPLDSQWTLEEVKTEGLSEVFTKWDVNVDSTGKVTISANKDSKDPDNLFTIDPSDNSKITIRNKPNIKEELGKFKIKKVNKDRNPIPQAGFTLYKNRGDENSKIGNETLTNDDGEIYYYNIPYGTYWLKETTVPEGYQAPSEENIWIEVTVNKETQGSGGVVVNPGDSTDQEQPDNPDPTDPENPVDPTPEPQPEETVQKSRITTNNTSGTINDSSRKLADITANLEAQDNKDIVNNYNLNLTIKGDSISKSSTTRVEKDKTVDVLFLVERSGSSSDSINAYNQSVGNVLNTLKNRNNLSRIGTLYYDTNGVENKTNPLVDAKSLSSSSLNVSYNKQSGRAQIDAAYAKAKEIMSRSSADYKIVVAVPSGNSLEQNSRVPGVGLDSSVNEIFVYSGNSSGRLSQNTYYNSGMKLATSADNVVVGTTGWFDKVNTKINNLQKTITTDTTTVTEPTIDGQTLKLTPGQGFEITNNTFTLPKLAKGQTHTINTRVSFTGSTPRSYNVLDNITITNGSVNISSPSVEIYEDSVTSAASLFKNLFSSTAYAAGTTNSTNEDYSKVGITSDKNSLPAGLNFDNVYTYTIVNKKKTTGEFKILKVDSENKPLVGVKFELTGPDNFIDKKTSDESGVIEFTNLTPGNYTLVESETKSGYIKTNQTWKVVVADNGRTTISPAGVSLTNAINSIDISESYASELPTTNKVNFVFIVENIKGKSENTIKQFNDSIETIRKDLADKYGSNATITLVSNGHQVMPGFDSGQPVIYANRPVTSNEEFKLVNLDQNGGDSHLDVAIKNARAAIKGNKADNYVFIMQSGNAEGYRYAFNNDKGLFTLEDNVKRSVMMFENASEETINAYTSGDRLGGLVSDKNAILTIDNQPIESIVKSQLTSSGVFEAANNNTSEVNDFIIPDAQKEALNNLEELKSKGFIITNSSGYKDSNISIIKVVNKKATYPSTGGSGTFIGFALIGTAIMLAGIAYYGIYVNDKNRRRSNRYGK